MKARAKQINLFEWSHFSAGLDFGFCSIRIDDIDSTIFSEFAASGTLHSRLI